jgi:CRP-like cAMP-binding protein
MSLEKPFIDFVSAYLRVSEEEKHLIAERVHHTSYPKNEVIHRQGDIPRTLAFVISGAVRIYYTDEHGTEHTVNFIFENQPMVAFDSFATQTPSGISAMTLEPTELIWTSHAEFFSFLEQHPRFETAVRSVMGHYMGMNSEHSKLLRINPARDRYEALCKARPELMTRVPLKYLASYIGMTLETLSRVRAGKL